MQQDKKAPDIRIIVPLDFDNEAKALEMARRLDPSLCRLKIGKELFTRCGPGVVEQVQGLGFEVFLDLKFHDIPNTVAQAVKAAASMGVWMVNVHASGGRAMLSAARHAVEQCRGAKPILTAVTVLTSLGEQDLEEIGFSLGSAGLVARLASLSKECGMDGVVCSAAETSMLKTRLGKDFLTVTPGIRPLNSVKGDQKRVVTPSDAVAAGSDYLVIGRPITQSDDPLSTLNKIAGEVAQLKS